MGIFNNHARVNQLGFAYIVIMDPNQVTDDSDQTTQELQRVHIRCLMKDVTREAKFKYFNHPMEFHSNISASCTEKDHLLYCILIMLLMNDGKLSNSVFHHFNKPSKQVQRCMVIYRLPASSTPIGDFHATA